MHLGSAKEKYYAFMQWVKTPLCGGIAQLVERQLCKLDVGGSNPPASTISSFQFSDFSFDLSFIKKAA